MDASTLPEGLTFTSDPLPTIRISTLAVQAAVTLQGAQIVEWQPAGEDPVLYLSGSTRWEPGVAIRGGIPVCFPWFGGGRRQPGLAPSHGWARITPWHLVRAEVDTDGTATLAFELTGADVAEQPHAELFPPDAVVRYTMSLGAELHLTVEVIAGASPLDVELLMHTYLRVQDIADTRVQGLRGAAYIDKVTQQQAVQNGEVAFAGETDRVYETGAPVAVLTPQRSIEITTTGSRSTVVWNPWIDKAHAMADFGDEDYRHMVCVESGDVAGGAITLDAGASHGLTVGYRLTAAR